MFKKQVFGKVTAYQCNGKIYKSRDKFLDTAVYRIYCKLEQSTGLRHMDEERVSWYNTRRVLNMETRRPAIEARIRRRLDRIV